MHHMLFDVKESRTSIRTPIAIAVLVLCASASSAQEAPQQSLKPIEVVGAGEADVSAKKAIKSEQIRHERPVDMKHVFASDAAVQVSSGTGLAQQINIRNLGEENIVLKIDGTSKSGTVFHHQSSFVFDPQLIKVIEVQKGTGSASAGFGVTGGQIQVTTVDAKDLLGVNEMSGAKVGLSTFNNSGKEVNVMGFTKVGQSVDALFAYGYVNQADYKTAEGIRVPYSALKQNNAMFKFGVDLTSDQRLQVSHRVEQISGNKPLRLNLSGLRNLPPFDTQFVQSTSNVEYSDKEVGGGNSIRANLFSQKVDETKQALSAIKGPPLPMRAESQLGSDGANLALSRAIGLHAFNYGLNYQDERSVNAAPKTGSGKEHLNQVGVYAEMIWDLSPIVLTTGARYDRYAMVNNLDQKSKGTNFNPSVAAIYDLKNGWNVRANYAHASRAPKMMEAYLLALPWADYRHLAKDLRAEKARNAELGLDYQIQHWKWYAGLHHLTIQNRFVEKEQGDISILQNAGALRNKGYELGMQYAASHFKAGVQVAHSKPLVDGKLPRVPAWLDVAPTGRTVMLDATFMPTRQWEFGWRTRSTASVATMDALTPSNEVRRAGYTVHDAYLNFKGQADAWLLGLYVNNLSNRAYLDQSNSICGPNNSSACNADPGRNVKLLVSYRF
jgi:hemoglobin/transferrin/lactoferrin receptor protein